ncbi:MAG: hypothetical protein A2X29_07160 [Elusimicrobia bacterium GWA2_64_40]|nr:MAG: hypothetical protein A2X29_07160 [Elusimicrobia bacterium GWA2_64_40]OGR64640.1 MAG: hypothetical protein A2X30_04320 [Elusimicrobia bacterium GWB2_63_16]HAN04424.1 hypothetical protein [Elusimicrobiota bacterium]
MNLIYLRSHAPKARKFIKKKLRRDEPSSIYDIEAGDCCLAPADTGGTDYILTFLNDASPEMLAFIQTSRQWTAPDLN